LIEIKAHCRLMRSFKNRRAEARLAKCGSEASSGADLPYGTDLPTKHGGGTRSCCVQARPRGDLEVEGKPRESCVFRDLRAKPVGETR